MTFDKGSAIKRYPNDKLLFYFFLVLLYMNLYLMWISLILLFLISVKLYFISFIYVFIYRVSHETQSLRDDLENLVSLIILKAYFTAEHILEMPGIKEFWKIIFSRIILNLQAVQLSTIMLCAMNLGLLFSDGALDNSNFDCLNLQNYCFETSQVYEFRMQK